MTSASTPRSITGQYTGRAGGARDGRDRADVIEVTVGDQDRLDLDPERVGGREQPLGLIAGVDDHRALGSSRRRGRCSCSPGPARR